jgi:hypothetical protein
MLEALAIPPSTSAYEQRAAIWLSLIEAILNEAANDAESYALIHLRDCSQQGQEICDGIALRLRTHQAVKHT